MAVFYQLNAAISHIYGGMAMAKTKSSVRGNQTKKIVPVKSYVKKDGTKVSGHRRSTPN